MSINLTEKSPFPENSLWLPNCYPTLAFPGTILLSQGATALLMSPSRIAFLGCRPIFSWKVFSLPNFGTKQGRFGRLSLFCKPVDSDAGQ